VADSLNTIDTPRVSFSSAGAVRSRPAADLAPNGLEAAFAEMLARMQRVPPRNLSNFVQVDDIDLQDRADTIRIHIRAFQAYIDAALKEAADHSWHVELASVFLGGLFEDMIGDACGCLQKAADKAREGVTWRAS
jgi:hypothetical protein